MIILKIHLQRVPLSQKIDYLLPLTKTLSLTKLQTGSSTPSFKQVSSLDLVFDLTRPVGSKILLSQFGKNSPILDILPPLRILSNGFSKNPLLKTRRQIQNGVACTKTHVIKPRLNHSCGSPRNGIRPIRNFLTSTSWVVCLRDPCHPVQGK